MRAAVTNTSGGSEQQEVSVLSSGVGNHLWAEPCSLYRPQGRVQASPASVVTELQPLHDMLPAAVPKLPLLRECEIELDMGSGSGLKKIRSTEQIS